MTTPRQTGPLLYNPSLLRREELIGSFVVRHGELKELVDRVRSAPAEHAPQHVLVLGWRGMGKTTLLHRLAYSVEDDPELRKTWLPVLFDEEQLNVGELADFWLNTLEMLSIAASDRLIKGQADEISTTLRGTELEETAYEALAETARLLDRRLLLLVDNVDLVLSRIDPDREASRLREILQHESWLMLVGTSSNAIESTYDYGQPFYEMFRVLELAPLNERQTLAMLSGLADRYRALGVTRVIREDPMKVEKLRLLMGGNPRTVGLLFGVLQEGPLGDLRNQLERLLDSSTSLYKERLESLPVQAQRVFIALAQRWEASTASQVADDLRLDRGAVSGQLHRLVEKGLVEKVALPRRALGFRVRERFFNIWCLMRGGRRSRQRLRWLVEAIELFYDADRLLASARSVIDGLRTEANRVAITRHLEFGVALLKSLPVPLERAALLEALLAALPALGGQCSEVSLELLDPSHFASLQAELPPAAALKLVRVAIEAGATDEILLVRAFQLLRMTRHNSEVLELAWKVAKKNPLSLIALREIAGQNLMMGDFDAAKVAVESLKEHAPQAPYTWTLSSNLHIFDGDLEKAKDAIARGLTVAPKDMELYVTALYLHMDISERALEALPEDRYFLPLFMFAACTFLALDAPPGKPDLKTIRRYLDKVLTDWPVTPFLYLSLLHAVACGFGMAVVKALDPSEDRQLVGLRRFLIGMDLQPSESQRSPSSISKRFNHFHLAYRDYLLRTST